MSAVKYLRGLPVDLYDRDRILAIVTGWLEHPDQHRLVITLNALMMLRAMEDARLHRIIGGADLVMIDGFGIRTALLRMGHGGCHFRGVDLARELLDWCSLRRHPVYFYGGSSILVDRLWCVLSTKWPRLNIAAIWDGYGIAAGREKICAELYRKPPGLLLVGLGSPAQEYFLAEILPKLPGTVGIGVGGALEVVAGLRREAPPMVRKAGLEWWFRMTQDPARLKLLPYLFRFLLKVIRNPGP